MRKFLLGILFVVLIVALFYKSPFSAMYNYNKAKKLYTAGHYEQSIPYFERSLFADKKGILARFYYVLALSKLKPTYSVQKKLYEMADSKIQDEAQKYAKSQTLQLRYQLLAGINDNFISNAPMGNDILRWDINSFPLKVYIETTNDIPEFYLNSIDAALALWTIRTNFVKFTKTKDKSEANIVIKFKDIPSDICKGEVCTYTAAYTEQEISKDNLLQKMNLTFYKTNPYKKNFSDIEIFNTALHEIGHTLGIMGHSDNPNDAMFAIKTNSDLSVFKSVYNSLSMRDLKTLSLLYRLQPTISNTKDLHSENFYYAPLIIGSEDARLQKKLEEYTKYIEQFPNFASGYINLAGVYIDLGDSENALKLLRKAKTLANNQDEEYIIFYNTAIIYYNKQEASKALEAANKAKAIKDDNSINDLITDINKLK